MADGTEIFNVGIPYIFGQAKDRDFKFDVCIDYEGNFENIKKLGQRGCDPVNATYILNLQTPVNI